jgi:hypothetical protein
MQFREFAQYHLTALEADEVRFNVQIALITAAMTDLPAGLRYWTLGEPGHCAVQFQRRAMLLGDLDPVECHCLARDTTSVDYPGVVGSKGTAEWFVEEAEGGTVGTETANRGAARNEACSPVVERPTVVAEPKSYQRALALRLRPVLKLGTLVPEPPIVEDLDLTALELELLIESRIIDDAS